MNAPAYRILWHGPFLDGTLTIHTCPDNAEALDHLHFTVLTRDNEFSGDVDLAGKEVVSTSIELLLEAIEFAYLSNTVVLRDRGIKDGSIRLH